MTGVCENEGHLGELSRTARVSRSALLIASALLATIALAGCGDGRRFTAEEFVDEVRAEGVELRLGEELFSEDESQETYAIELAQVAKLPGEGHEGPTTGSISVFDDTGGADEKLESCMATADLLCFQASNVAVVLEGSGIEAQQLGIAIERISEDE